MWATDAAATVHFMREERLLSLVSLIHETVLSADGWAAFAEGLEDAIPGSAISLIVPKQGDVPVIEVVDRDSLEWHAPSFRPDLVPLFLERFRYPSENPFAIPRTFPPGTAAVHWSNDLVSLEEFRKGAMFNEWIAPQDLALGPNLVAYLYSDGRPDIPALHLFRRKRRRPFGTEEQRALKLLLPHIRQAIRARFHLAAVQAERDALADVLDRLTLGVLMIAADGRVCGSNQSARDLLERRDGLEYTRGELRAATPRHTSALRRLLGEATQTGQGTGTRAGGFLKLPRKDDQRDLVVIVTPLRVPEGRVHGKAPAAAVFLAAGLTDAAAVEELLRGLYDLTPREARLARELAEGRTLAEAAARLGTTVATERSRLRDIFAKTGTQRQASLVRSVLLDTQDLRFVPSRGA